MKLDNFDEYMSQFKEMSIEEKRKIIINQIKVITILSNDMCKSIGVNNELILNKDLLYKSEDDYTEENFINSLLVLINSIQNSLSDFNIGLDTLMDKMLEMEEK